VCNGENFIDAALNSIVSQTFRDFELIISDNASTDRTEAICRQYAARDPRVTYIRQPHNLGAAPNYNFVFHQSRGEYFKWAAHDDVLHPHFLEKTVEVLDAHSEVGLVFTKARRIDERGEAVGTYDQYYGGMRFDSKHPHVRFGDMICQRHNCFALFGLMRREHLAATHLHGAYPGGDRTLLGEMALRAQLHQIQDYLFDRRDHPGAYSSQRRDRNLMSWWDTDKGHLRFPNWRRLEEHLASIDGAGLPLAERFLCRAQFFRWVLGPTWYRQRWVLLGGDLLAGAWQGIRQLLPHRRELANT
jgi:glycosyltransferase involved in cell wall biosynthesis